MKLRNKIILIMLVLWGAMLGITYLGSQTILNKSYLDLEEKQANNNLHRIDEAILQMIGNISRMTANWAIWDDTYKFAIDRNKSYLNTNLVINSFASTDADMIFYLNSAGTLIYSMAVNEAKTKEIPVPKSLNVYLTPNSPLVHHEGVRSSKAGLISIPEGILFIASHPIVTSNNTGPLHGTLVMAKYLTKSVEAKLENITKIDLSIYQLRQPNLPQDVNNAYQSLQNKNDTLFVVKNKKRLLGYRLLKDINGQPIAIIRAELPRGVYRVGLETINYYNTVFALYSLLAGIVLWCMLHTLLVRRIENLKDQIGKTTHKSALENIMGPPDEVTAVATLYHQATHDPLTGLANRNLLNHAFEMHIKTVDLSKQKIALLFIDIDYFKRVNDSLGHDVGDLLLISIANKINACLREFDLAVRIGGDEFIVLLVDISTDNIKQVVERIDKALSEVIYIKNHELQLTVSIGISICPDDGMDIATLIKNADIALYHAKETGRNHYQYYSEKLNLAILEANNKVAELQSAIDNKELTLFYQPIYHAESGKLMSLEALLRWHHPTRGLVSALDIIPLAEKSGLIVPIGQWILSTACAQAKMWKEEGFLEVPIAVNISITQLKNISLHNFVMNALTEVNLDPHYLELELTETSYIEINDKILAEMGMLKKSGVQLVVDDFGIGYSGLGYLRSLPISKLKIDKSFVDDIFSNPDDCAITLAIIAIAHQLNLKVIAEGVETAEQYQFLKQHGVDGVQGLYFSKPLSSDEVKEYLQKFKVPSAEV